MEGRMGAKRVETAEALKSFVEDVRSKATAPNECRCLCVDESSIVNDWDLIREQHRQLAYGTFKNFPDVSIAHLLIPAKHTEPPEEAPSIILERKLKQVLAQFNALAWLTIYRWFWGVSERYESMFHPTDSEEYTLHAYLEDFRHQVFSIVLRQEIAEMLEAMENGFCARKKEMRVKE